MDDNTRAALDTETPVNPYSLLDALNTAAQRSSTLWLLFLGLMAYLAVAVAGITHRDLLLDSGIAMPLLGTRLDIIPFLIVSPALFLLAHLTIVAQHTLLARKAVEFDSAVRLLESTDLRSHPLRLELDSYFLAQSLAGPERSGIVSALLSAVAWLTLVLLPLALLLFMQIALLPMHDAAATAAQRVVVLADIVVLLLAGVFLRRADTSFLGAALRLVLGNPGRVVAGLVVLAGAAYIALFAATVPGTTGGDRAVLGLFPRSIVVTDANLASDQAAVVGARSISLRGRDLRFARLDRSDLRRADLTGARLDGASLVGADLRGAQLGCASRTAPVQDGGREMAGCTSARAANFSGARLMRAGLVGADLGGARFDDATLEGADLSQARLAAASFEHAKLQQAKLSAALQGSSLAMADLQGADLHGARLEMADLSGARLQAATLASAHLAGAVLRDVDLEGADLRAAKLYAADLGGAKLVAADLAGAVVWRTVPPKADAVALADLAGIAIAPPDKDDMEALTAAAQKGEGSAAGERAARLSGLVQELGSDNGWAASSQGQAWVGLLRASQAAMAEGFKMRLSEHLGRMACRTRFADGVVAAAIVRRALGTGFKGEPGPLYNRLKAAECPGARVLPPFALIDLGAAAEAAKPAPAASAAAPVEATP